MKYLKYLYLAIVIAITINIQAQQKSEISLIPQPSEITVNKGYFRLNNSVKINISSENKEVESLAKYLQKDIVNPTGLMLTIQSNSPANNAINLIINTNKNIEPEGYQLIVEPTKVDIIASTTVGIFYGIQTFRQLFPAEFESKLILKHIDWKAPCVIINDAPTFPYRGMHLDVGRHFFPASFIKKYIDILAMHKINTFHWHLTEDQGWRIEIKKYPKLTEIGAYRKETIVGHARNSNTYDNTPYGGFYTQKEVKEIVNYAQSKFITIIPEIELPGHSIAALAAYPELGCTGGPYEVYTTWGIIKEVYCAGNEQTFTFLQDVLSEVMELFPSKYIHIGGDECPKARWKECEKCQQRIKNENLKDEHELQSYFVTRIEKFLNANGRRMIGWDEILEGGLAPDATVMSWRGTKGGIEAAESRHDVIMTPNTHCYFDHYQANPDFEPQGIGGFLTLKKVYSFNPIPEDLDKEYHKYIIGGQANLWTEYIPTADHLEYMMVPRISALAEAIWSKPENRNWSSFQQKMQKQYSRYDVLNINYSKGSYKIDISTESKKESNKVFVNLETEQLNTEIRYTLDGSTPTIKSELYTKDFAISETTTIKAGQFENGQLVRSVSEKKIFIHKALGKLVDQKNAYNYKFNGGGNYALVDGIIGSKKANDGCWQGYEGVNIESVIDLEDPTDISQVKMNFLQLYNSWIFLPQQVDIYTSETGKQYKLLGRIKNTNDLSTKEPQIETFELNKQKTNIRYIKVVAKNIAECPKGHPGEGGKAWLFIDEIIIN